MRNREAARYARWSAIISGLIVLAVAGVYIDRAVQRARARREMPAAVPASVERRSAQFTYSKVEQDRTVFTIRASQATQYRDHDRALLQDVWITIYGRDGKHNDNIHTRQCSYDPQGGGARCQGAVEIEIDAAKAPNDTAAQPALQLATSDLTFNRDTGNASTPAPVTFTFPGGSGSGMGVDYSTHDATIRVQRSVQFRLAASEKDGGLPVSAAGTSLEIERNTHTVVLNGPVNIRQGARRLTAGKILVSFDAANRARQVLVEDQPAIHAVGNSGAIAISASQFQGVLNPAGWVERVIADGNVQAVRQAKAGNGRFEARHVEFSMIPGRDLVQRMTATGGVLAESQGPAAKDTLRTEALRLAFAAPDRKLGSARKAPPSDLAREQIAGAETLAPATIETARAGEITSVSAKKLVARSGASGRIDKLYGHSGVVIRRTTPGGEPQTMSAAELAATLGPRGGWDTVEESGGVRIQQGARTATAKSARIDRATGAIELQGSPVVADGASRTSAASIAFDQQTGALRATGEVVSTYLPDGNRDSLRLGEGAAHITADTLTGSAKAGRLTYAGHARLWQGESVLEADRIELWQGQKKLEASGNVLAVFPQSAGPSIPNFEAVGGKVSKDPGPTLWKIRAPQLTFWGDRRMAHLQGGVVASSSQGTLHSRTLDVYLAPGGAKDEPGTSAGHAAAVRVSPAPLVRGGGQLERVVARGNVVVEQGLRRGVAQQAEYTASDGKFVLSGGEPTVTDGSSNSATGSSLTFYVASDTIFLESRKGSRTLTKHKVEK